MNHNSHALCGACGSKTIQIGEKFNISILSCRNCGSITADCEEPPVDFYEESYFGGDEYGYTNEECATTNLNEYDSAAKRRLAFLTGSRKVIEVGSGNGSFVRAALNNGIDIVGIERSKYMREVAQKVYGVKLLDHIPPLSNDSLVLVLIEVIEHVKRPLDFLKNIIDSLEKTPERILFTTPNGEAVASSDLNWEQIKPPEHLLLFTAKGLKIVLQSLGYNTIRFKYYHSFFLNISIKKLGCRSSKKVPFLWAITSLLRIADPVICQVMPKRFSLGLECYCER